MCTKMSERRHCHCWNFKALHRICSAFPQILTGPEAVCVCVDLDRRAEGPQGTWELPAAACDEIRDEIGDDHSAR